MPVADAKLRRFLLLFLRPDTPIYQPVALADCLICAGVTSWKELRANRGPRSFSIFSLFTAASGMRIRMSVRSAGRSSAGGASAGRNELTGCLLRIAQGERAALEALYRLTSAKLFAVGIRILNDRAEAEDVLQEVFLTVWNKAALFEAERGLSPMTWLISIMRNRALDRLRAKKQRFGGLDEAVEIPDLEPLADAALAAQQNLDRLTACLEQLDARARQAIRAAFFGGQTYELLAKAAEIPLGSMKSLIRRGLMRLKACLES